MQTKITTTNREILSMLKGLEKIKQLKGSSRFAILVGRNIKNFAVQLQPIEKAAIPSQEFIKLSMEIQSFIEKEDEETIAKIEEENKELVEARKQQMADVESLLDTETEVHVELIEEKHLPSEVSPEDLMPLLNLIKE